MGVYACSFSVCFLDLMPCFRPGFVKPEGCFGPKLPKQKLLQGKSIYHSVLRRFMAPYGKPYESRAEVPQGKP